MIQPKAPLVTGFTNQEGAYLPGNLAAISDWDHAHDYVEMQWLLLQQEQPEDYVIASGKQHKVHSFVDLAAGELAIYLTWRGQSVDEQGYDA
jgi:GDPmannose 4,6-dehydratase